MEGQRQPPSAGSAAVLKVLDDDNLLIEILLRVSFPTTLVRAALVCKRWLHHATDNEFLRRFRELHPPRLLGFYIDSFAGLAASRFVPMLPQPPELTAVIRDARFCPDIWHTYRTNSHIMDCRNGSVFTERYDRTGYKFRVHSPLYAGRGMTTIPPFPRYKPQDGSSCIWVNLLSKEQGADLSYFLVSIETPDERTKFTAHVYMLQDGVWCMLTHHSLVTDQPSLPLWELKPVLVDSNIYIAAAPQNIIILNLTVSSFSTIYLPQGVEYGDGDTTLSRTDDTSGVYLIQAKELQLHIWLYKWVNWLLINTIYLREMCGNLRMSDSTTKAGNTNVLRILQVGDNAEFVFFQMDRFVLYLDIKCMTLRKVHEMTKQYRCPAFSIYPFKMIWPPRFPALKDDPSRNDVKTRIP